MCKADGSGFRSLLGAFCLPNSEIRVKQSYSIFNITYHNKCYIVYFDLKLKLLPFCNTYRKLPWTFYMMFSDLEYPNGQIIFLMLYVMQVSVYILLF